VADAAKVEDGEGPVFEAHRRLLQRLARESFERPGRISRREDVDEQRYLWLSGVVVIPPQAVGPDDPPPQPETIVELRGLRLCLKGVTIL
jgi:hypothetical protein